MLVLLPICRISPGLIPPWKAMETQLTHQPCGHILTNVHVHSPDSQWIVYDLRSDPAGSVFDGKRIEAVNVHTREVRVLYESKHGACCGVATFSPVEPVVAFILGPEHPTPDWTYAASRRQGVRVHWDTPGQARNLDARDLAPPFTPGALRGGTHVHVHSGDGRWLSFTYNDHVLSRFASPAPDHDMDARNVAVAAPCGPVTVPRTHPRNHDGEFYCVLVTRTHDEPEPGSDQIRRACEDAWIGSAGYLRADGTRQHRALAFLGDVITRDGAVITELYAVDLPEDVSRAGDAPLQGTATRRPAPPLGTVQRRLTRTTHRKHPGVQGPRHWPRSSPDGSRIAFLMKDDQGVVQLWTVSPLGGEPSQLTRSPSPVESAFTFSPDGRLIACVIDRSVCVVETDTGEVHRLTPRCDLQDAPRPEACVFAPDGKSVAFVRNLQTGSERWNQVCCVTLD